MKTNNFKTILEEDEQYYALHWQEQGRAGLRSALEVYKFIGRIVEVYVPRAVDVLLSATDAGHPADIRRRPPDAPADDKAPGGPSAPQDDIRG